VPKKVLDGDHLGLRVEQLGGHGVAQLVTADSERGLPRIVLDSFLDAPHRYRLSSVDPLFNDEDPPGSRGASHSEVIDKRLSGVIADVYHPLLAPLRMTNKDPVLSQIQVCKL